MASYNPSNDTFETVCKVGSGFTDEDLEKIPELIKPYIKDRKPLRVVAKVEPDVWVEPALVAEIIGAELTLSPVHTCAYGRLKSDAGVSIRFPRFIRWRDDKGPEDATTSDELIEMYKMQLKRISEKPMAPGEESKFLCLEPPLHPLPIQGALAECRGSSDFYAFMVY